MIEREKAKNLKKGNKKMAAHAVNLKPYGCRMIEDLKTSLGVSETMLAALLDVTTRTLHEWKDKPFTKNFPGKAKRLDVLWRFVDSAIKSGVEQKHLLALLNNPINPEDEESLSLRYYITCDPNPNEKQLQELLRVVIRDYLRA
jgi:DNA-binding transcriptional regulator YiaG